MDVTTVLQEVNQWPVEDRLHLLETMWDDLIQAGVEPAVTEAQRVELDARLADLAADSTNVVPWELVQAQIRRPQ